MKPALKVLGPAMRDATRRVFCITDDRSNLVYRFAAWTMSGGQPS